MNSGHNFQKVRWHSRRGMLELDLILVPFAEQHFLQLPVAVQDDYVRLLGCEDQDLLAWLLGHSEPEDERVRDMVALIRQRHAGQ